MRLLVARHIFKTIKGKPKRIVWCLLCGGVRSTVPANQGAADGFCDCKRTTIRMIAHRIDKDARRRRR